MKLAQSYAKYGKAKPGGDECRACRWFDALSSCEIVEGRIARDGWCRFFHRRARTGADMMRRGAEDRAKVAAMRARDA